MDEDPIVRSSGGRKGETVEVNLDGREAEGTLDEVLHLGDCGARVVLLVMEGVGGRASTSSKIEGELGGVEGDTRGDDFG